MIFRKDINALILSITPTFFRSYIWKKRIRKHACKLATGLSALHKSSTLILESHVRLGNIYIRSHNLEIGAHTYIRSGCTLHLIGSIGRFCSISSNVYIGHEKHTHPLQWVSSHPFQYTNNPCLAYHPNSSLAEIGHDVWIGDHAILLEGITIGTGAIIATHAVVTKDVPAYAIVAGNPAKIVGYRHAEEIRQALLASKWWEYPIKILQTLPLDKPEHFIKAINLLGANKATYQKIKVTSQACKVV